MLSRNPQSGDADEVARPFCLCWDKKEPVQWRELSKCSCGEEEEGEKDFSMELFKYYMRYSL